MHSWARIEAFLFLLYPIPALITMPCPMVIKSRVDFMCLQTFDHALHFRHWNLPKHNSRNENMFLKMTETGKLRKLSLFLNSRSEMVNQ